MRSVLLILLAATVAGCTNPLNPAAVAGIWTEDFTIPGNFRQMGITNDGSELAGTGNFCGEAGPCGEFTVSGSVVDNEVRLDFRYTNGVIRHFVGHVKFDTLQGLETGDIPSLPPGPPAAAVTFRRAPPIGFL